MHLFHLLFFIMVGLYYMTRRLFACQGHLTNEVLPPVVELPVEAFVMRRYVQAVTRADHVSHLEGVATRVLQSMPFERLGKLSAGGRNLAFQGLTFVPPYCSACLLGTEDQNLNVLKVSQGFFSC